MTSSNQRIRHAVGVMTGTSIDGIDAAIVRIEGQGVTMHASLVRHHSQPLGEIALRLRAAAEQKPMTSMEFAKLAWDVGQLHCEVIDRLTKPHDAEIALICAHGQTVFHQPPISWQILNPAPIAARLNCPVVSDLRQADLTAGGQGAPITPIADWIVYRDSLLKRAVINLGGFCNVTVLPCDSTAQLSAIRGFDVCACNQILDAVARVALNTAFDRNGAAASRGKADSQAVNRLLQILTSQRDSRRSLGTGDESTQWVNEHRSRIDPADLAASAVEAIARSIANSLIEYEVDELVIAGGGAHNRALVDAIGRIAGKPLITTAKLGVPIEAREAMAFAVLGALCADGVPISLPQVTGCVSPAPLSGSWLLPTRGINAVETSQEARALCRE